MYAIVEISGKQYRVTKEMRVKVPLLDIETGKKMTIDRVLAYADDKGDVAFGTPVIENMNVIATVLEHGRDKKIIVFKKKRRKGYKKKQGHRQGYSLIEITDIGLGKKTPTAAKAKADSEKKSKPKVEPKKAKPTEVSTVKSVSKKTQAGTAKKSTATTRTTKSATTPKKAATKTSAKTTAKPKATKTIKDKKEKKDGS